MVDGEILFLSDFSMVARSNHQILLSHGELLLILVRQVTVRSPVGYGSKLGTPIKLDGDSTKLDFHIYGPTSVFHFDPHPFSWEWYPQLTFIFFRGVGVPPTS